jgi:glutamate synthase (NADPH/NADH) large chain
MRATARWKGRNEVPDTLDAQMMHDAGPVRAGEKMQLTYNIRNTQRAIGTRSRRIVRKFGMTGCSRAT